jgi:hypothetical protein
VINFSVVGQTIEGLTASAPGQFGTATGLKSSGTNSCFGWDDTNSLTNIPDSAATAFAAAQAFYSLVHGYGFTFLTGDCLPRTGLNETTRATYNALKTAGAGTAFDAGKVAPFAADARFGGSGDETNTLWYQSDQTHPLFALAAVLASYVVEMVEPGSTGTPLTAVSSTSGIPAVYSKKKVSLMDFGTRQINDSTHDITFTMVDAATGLIPQTGLTVTGHIRKNGQAPGTPSATVQEIGNGKYAFTGAGLAKDLSTLGLVYFWGTASGAQMAPINGVANSPVEILVTGRNPIDVAENRATRLP